MGHIKPSIKWNSLISLFLLFDLHHILLQGTRLISSSSAFVCQSSWSAHRLICFIVPCRERADYLFFSFCILSSSLEHWCKWCKCDSEMSRPSKSPWQTANKSRCTWWRLAKAVSHWNLQKKDNLRKEHKSNTSKRICPFKQSFTKKHSNAATVLRWELKVHMQLVHRWQLCEAFWFGINLHTRFKHSSPLSPDQVWREMTAVEMQYSKTTTFESKTFLWKCQYI